ncbi:g8927 [Coccomyxa viridis]|uniref:G8927 protein n=1 Tax=Coccomyxa viridis TaxID=1274662 RepID=A0ABP1G464_9CHLO
MDPTNGHLEEEVVPGCALPHLDSIAEHDASLDKRSVPNTPSSARPSTSLSTALPIPSKDDGAANKGPRLGRKVGRPILYTGDPNAPGLTSVERQTIARRNANRHSAKRFAYYLFWNLSSDPERDYIVVEDLRELVPAESVREAFGVLDRDDSGQATLEEIQESVSEVFRERRNLAETLQDTRNIVGRLDWIFCVILQIVNCFIILAIFDANVKQIWLTFSSAIILFSFVFASSIKNLFENVMFLLATHPYDVGDQIQLDTGDTLTVESMSIVTTHFIKSDNSRTYIPNIKLSQQSITNLTRSEKKNDSFRVFLDLNTPVETFTELQEMVQRFIDDNPQDYCGECTVQAVAFQDPLKLQLSTNWSYCHAPFEGKKIGKARHNMFLIISGFLANAKADYTLPDLSRSDEKTAQAVASVLRPIRELESG